MSGLLFDRRCNLFVATAGGSGLDLGELHVKFKITRADVQSPNWADITVHNLKDETARQIRKEFTQLILQAGYREAFGVIFKGSIRQVRLGRENGTDTFISIAAADGDIAYNFATVNKTLEAGATLAQQVKAALDPMSAHGVDPGFIDFSDLGGPKLPRGKVMFGMSRDYLRSACQNAGATWSIQNGKVQIIKRTGLLPGQAFNLTSSSGLIGTPTQTDRGVEARHLIHPDLIVGAKVKIDQASILEAQLEAPTKSSSESTKKKPAAIATDGAYRVYIAEYEGDNRDNPWYVDLVCLGVNESAPAGLEVDPQ